ncbi:conserved oligomeric Golgi complex subunit 2-like [Chenopodium quinoa]|uniref:Conserved oligomeric Golgi complex subunit 2 n=1 Tax=Chenopodium quinoa TaxID=63459 RepID=A0A803MIC3_CHEQI|nr:conserved oligomeric Golgi complex subunit 2-like [Chenopodium quinoa]
MASADLASAQPPPTPPPRSHTDLFGDPINDSSPLWFKKDLFLSPDFDCESYISDLRTFVPFDTLRSQLHAHLSSLKHQLVDLINRDYNDFVNLSTNLVDVDSSVARMRAPLSDLREKIAAFRNSVQDSLVSLQNGLNQRAEAANAREILELLLDTFHVVSKVEKLIKELPSVPADWSNGDMNVSEKSHLSNGISLQQSENESNVRETQSMLLERIASEMNRLKFYMAHAKDLPFIQNVEKRFQSASHLLDASLGHCFLDGLEHRDENAIYNCLRAYAAIDSTSNAEEIFRSTIVAPLIEKIIPHGSSGLNGVASVDELEADYREIKQCIEKDCTFLLRISSREDSGFHVFNFLANSILREVHSAIQKGKPGAFSPGRPTEFLKNYKSSLEFLSHLEGYCTSRYAVSKFRTELVYVDFMKQWNLGVYFSLRFQEIAGALDSVLVTPSLVVAQGSRYEVGNFPALVLKQSITLLESLRSCWGEDVLVLSCSDKFLRLSLQLLSRYSSWLSHGLNARQMGHENANPGAEWAISAGPEDLLYIIHDVKILVDEVCGNYIGHVMEILSSCPAEVMDPVKQSILQSAKSLEDMVPSVIKSIVDMLVEKSVEALLQLKGISATYRMTNKPLPIHHSPYVSAILHPLKAFLEGDRAATYLDDATKFELIQGAALEITKSYNELVSELVNVARKTESSLQRLRQGAQRRTGASSDVSDHNVSNTDKICMQLFLDIQEYGRNLATIGVDTAKIKDYQALWQCVAPAEKQSTIVF